MRGVALAAAFLMAATLLAGCSHAPSAPAEVVVHSAPLESEVRSNDTAGSAAVAPPPPKTRGHIAGVVVDQAIRPVAGAKVHLPGLDLTRTTDRDGAFGFVDLYPGPYFITINATGFYPAEAVLQVKEDEFTRAKVVLSPIPPPEPYHVTQKFDGFADVTAIQGDPFLLTGFCGTCSFDFYVDRPNLQSVVVEAVMDSGGQQEGFYHELRAYDCCEYYSQGDGPNPLVQEVKDIDLGKGDRFDLFVQPESFPAPETSRHFEVFVTAFYNQPAPTGWSIVGGST